MMEEIFLAVGDALVYLAGPMHKKYSTTIAWGYPFYARILGSIFQPPHTYVLNNMTQMLQVNKNSNIKYNMIQVKLK